MSDKPIPTDLPMYSFASAQEFEAFLDREHTVAPGFYVKLAKKASGITSISREEAVEVVLCFGWIDGWGRGIDQDWFFTRYTPRRAKSIWSQKNVNTVSRLAAEGRMRPAGLAAVEAAKADGRWERAYAGPATITVPDDFAAVLATKPTAASFFEGLNRTDRYSVLWRIETASLKTRAKRIEALVQMLSEGQRPTVLTGKKKPSVKVERDAVVKKSTSKVTTKKSDSRLKQEAETFSVDETEIKSSSSSSITTSQSRRPGLRNSRS